jgi:iron complex outermembrane receptor protein
MHLLFMILLAVSPFQIDEVEVTAERAQIQSEAFRLVAQVGHEEIAQMPVKDVADILAYLPGVDVRSRGAMQRDVSLHGGTFDQVLILLNGVSLQDAQTGHYTMNIPVHPSMIERIEILQGTAVHLTGAFSGAINIVTRDAQQDQYTVALSAGNNSEISPVANGSWVRGETRVNASVDYARSDGYYAPDANEREQEALLNTGYQTANIYLQTRWRGLDVQTGAQYKDAGLGTGYGHASTDQFDATRTLFASARYTAQAGQHWSLTAQAAYRTNYDRYEWHKGTAQPNIHWTHNAQAALQAHYASSIGRTSIGAEVRNEYIRSSNMGEHNRTQVTCSAEQQFIWQGLAASIGLAGHYNSLFGWYGSGAANIGYTFRKTGSVYISATRSLRMPTWTDMYYKAGVQRGSEDLKAERAWMLSAGGQYNRQWEQAGSLHLSGDVWYRWGQDIIDWTYNETDSLFHATNRHSVDAFGIDLVAQYKLNRWLRNITVRYAFSHLSLDLAQTNSQYLDYLRHKVTATVNHGIYVWDQGCVGAKWSLRWQDRRGTYVDIYGTAGNPFRPVLLMDGTIYMELAHVRVAIECTNMTNRHYYDYGGVLMQGIQGRLCVTARF